MSARLLHFTTAMLIVGFFVPLVPNARSDELPEGIKVTVIAKYESRVSALDHVRLVRVLMQPGSAFDNVVVKNEEYCELRRGTLTHTNHVTGITDVFTVGARWAPPKGSRHTVTNTGDDVADMWVYQLIEKDEDAGKM